MESLGDTKWDVVIEGTDLQHSLLALALSRSDKKILHVDENPYYGGAEAAFSLQEVDEWIERLGRAANPTPFQNANLWKAAADDAESEKNPKLSFSRAYTLTLSPQIIYTTSKLLSYLVSSKVYKQLEFQAVGNWWIYGADGSSLTRLPNGREDIFQDKNIDNRSKRGLMKFLKFVVDYENQSEVWEAHGENSLYSFLSSQFRLPDHLQMVISALALPLESSEKTTVNWALPRIARHLTSIGRLGPGFGAVVPKWGGGAEIAQVACRSGAVGGGVYVLDCGITDVKTVDESEDQPIRIALSNGENVGTKLYIQNKKVEGDSSVMAVSRIVAVISSSLSSIFRSSVEGAPLAAVSVVVFPPKTLQVENDLQENPVYIMVHSNETGECPAGQCVLYATTLHNKNSKAILELALATFNQSVEEKPSLLYSLYYEQKESKSSSLDMSFDDQILARVEEQWKEVIGQSGGDEASQFMQFEERKGMNAYDDDDEVY
ncbi:hypothetical protein HYFRA_00005894 [Hymenoscyphus fraxineus]|uniref:Rab proteins geranylgeranyltransferase n=1 Tax=Hymenoscyphus fraxineus TaxID=746836 RepID=A0A9N9PID3_9HELO|nr:hypothetical protein HYFRA_00005894 [Hymenoscyphus fraxineus]